MSISRRDSLFLGVNIDHCATLRQARYRQAGLTTGGNVEPDPVTFAMLCERAGADCITVHLREDQRHIQERDVWRLRESCATRLNLEMACTPAMTEFALRLKPDSVCLVPESREEVTTEGGLDVVKHRDKVQRATDAMNAARINTSLFIDADEKQIALAAKIGAPWIELHTGAYANAYHGPHRVSELKQLHAVTPQAHELRPARECRPRHQLRQHVPKSALSRTCTSSTSATASSAAPSSAASRNPSAR